jgi:hypothetical protein
MIGRSRLDPVKATDAGFAWGWVVEAGEVAHLGLAAPAA